MIPPRVSVDIVRERIGAYADKAQTADQRYQIYKELIGFLPPRIEARINVTGALDPELLDLQERMRARAMYPKCFDVKTSQLMLFGMLLMDMNDAAPLHGIAARRAGDAPVPFGIVCRATGPQGRRAGDHWAGSEFACCARMA